MSVRWCFETDDLVVGRLGGRVTLDDLQGMLSTALADERFGPGTYVLADLSDCDFDLHVDEFGFIVGPLAQDTDRLQGQVWGLVCAGTRSLALATLFSDSSVALGLKIAVFDDEHAARAWLRATRARSPVDAGSGA